ncbi:MAG: hypothetical protein B6I24_09950 [Bacteroidetes bacterium 4572_128]|nr:MAG: hypothetical protein B6I24_09950 [Bacteroidetes bacterium 4572_128]
MEKRDRYIKRINRSLSLMRFEIEQLNKINLTDYNIIAENFYKDLLVFYGFELKNLNEKKYNAESIDLVDEENKIAIQVTSRNDAKKIHDTIKGFNKPEYDEYKQLIMFLIGKPKLKYKADFTKKNLFSFDKKKDIIDVDDIIKKFRSYPAKQLEPIVDFLEKKSEINEKSDPDGKSLRFIEHFDFLMTKYGRFISIYTGALLEAKSDIDGVRVNKINVYLQNLSDDYLTKYSNNPKDALNELVNYFETEISTSNTNYDRLAIEFYLLDELINCNVFPNPKT